jgi:heme/copper-type cytochrome/quinol oxidase subunit 2
MFLRPLLVSDPATLKGKLLAIIIAVVMVSLYLFNYHRYKNRDEEIKEKYKDSKANKWFKLWMFPIIILLLYFLPFIIMGHTEYV